VKKRKIMEQTLVNDHRFKPGNVGRPKGTPNKLTTEKKQRLERILEIIEENLEDDIKGLKRKDRVDLWIQLQEYVRPKLQRVNVDIGPAEDKLTKITFEVIHTTVLPGANIKTLPIGDECSGIRSIPEKL
jgi:hypothetical protein